MNNPVICVQDANAAAETAAGEKEEAQEVVDSFGAGGAGCRVLGLWVSMIS